MGGVRSEEEVKAIKVLAYAMAARALAEKSRGPDAVMMRLDIDTSEVAGEIAWECVKALGYDGKKESIDPDLWGHVELKGLKS